MIDTHKKEATSINAAKNSTTSLVQTPNSEITNDAKNLALLNWLGCLFFGFIPPLIILLTQKDNAYVQQQAKEALNWSITMLLGYVGLWILAVILGVISFGILAIIPMLLIGVIAICHLIFCIMGTIKCSSGKLFRAPFNIRLIK